MKTDATAAAQKWATAMGAAGPAYTAGVQRVTTAPGQAAARQQAVYIARVTERAPVWATNVAAVSLGAWQTAAVNKGATRLGSGATAAQPKFLAFMQALLSYEANGLTQLPARGDFGANQQRMINWSNYMHSFTKPTGT